MRLERFLEGVKPPVGRGEAFNGRNGGTIGLHRERKARASGLAVDQDGAAAAHTVLAADVCARKPDGVTQDVGE
jgi:hypothetical protein